MANSNTYDEERFKIINLRLKSTKIIKNIQLQLNLLRRSFKMSVHERGLAFEFCYRMFN